jgi:hypothetical protein
MTESTIEYKINAARTARLSDDGGLSELPLEQVNLAQFNSHGDALRRKDPIAFTTIQRNLLVSFIKSQMVAQHDYGNIPGVKEKSLFKAGAERLATLFNLGVQLHQVSAKEDYDKGFFAYCYRATVRDRTGFILAECEGVCNSKEKKYRTQDPFSIVNTISKMAQKRAYVGAVILACNASSFFKNAETMQEVTLSENRPTWDIEAEVIEDSAPAPKITDAQRKRFWTIATNSGFSKPAVKTWLLSLGITSTRDIPEAQYDLLCIQAEQPPLAEFWNCQVANE